MRAYEPFKTEAKRLTSITCDRCSVEMYSAAYQLHGDLNYRGPYIEQSMKYWVHGGYDLCPDCLTGARAALVSYIGREPSR